MVYVDATPDSPLLDESLTLIALVSNLNVTICDDHTEEFVLLLLILQSLFARELATLNLWANDCLQRPLPIVTILMFFLTS